MGKTIVRVCTIFLTLLILGLYLSPHAFATTGTNKQISFQGKVVNTNGTNVATANYDFEFKIYTVSSGGAAIWTETRTGANQVTVTDGVFQVNLGSVTALPGSVDFNTDNIYLGINFNNNGEMTPRVQFTAVPQAFNALKVAGLTVTDTTGTLTIPSGKTISFADAFTTSGAFPLTFTTTASTNVTLPTTGTLLTNTASAVQTITSTQTIGTILGVSDATGLSGSIKGLVVTLSGINAFDQTGLEFNLSNATGTNLNDIVGTAGSWKVSKTGGLTVSSCSGCGGGGGSNWTLDTANGVLRPNNNVIDVLLGGTASTSAKFAFLNMDPNSGKIPTASISGNIVIGNKPDSTDSSYTFDSPAAGQLGADSSITGVVSSAIYKGKLFVSSNKANAAGIYRYDGGTTWTLVTAAVGKVLSAESATVDSYAISVFNGKLIIGTRTGSASGLAGIYTSEDAHDTAMTTTWTLVNTTLGQFVSGTTGRDGVDDIAVYNGFLYILTQEVNGTEVLRYAGGTGASVFVKISAILPGEILAADLTDGDGGVMVVFGGRLYVGVRTGSTTGRVFYYDGNAAETTSWILVNSTRGTFDAVTGEPDVVSMIVHNGALWITTGKADAANIYKLRGGFTSPAGAAPFQRMTPTVGKVTSGDTANIDAVILKSYQGRLYAGTQTGAGTNTGALYEYDPSNLSADAFTIIGARGTFGSQTNVDDVTMLQPMNGVNEGTQLYIGTQDSTNIGSVYDWSKFKMQSYSLRMDSGNSNLGSLIFTGDDQAADNNGRLGKFLFSHAVNFAGGSFDYAEEYPTADLSLQPGEIVAVDPFNKEYVRRALPTDKPLGIYSASPGFLISPTQEQKNDAFYVPIALVGRVAVNISTENGAINPGDYVTLSTQSGVAMKATKAGAIIGQAMEAYTGTGIGKILVFVQTSFFTGEKLSNLPGLSESSNTSEDILKALVIAKDQGVVGGNISEVFTDRLVAAQEVITPQIITDILYAKKIKADSIEGLEILTDKISSLQGQVAGLAVPPLEATPAASIASLPNSIKLDNGIFTGETIFEKLVTFLSNIIFKGKVSFEQIPTFNNDTAGFAVIEKDADTVIVSFEKAYETAPIVSASFSFAEFKKEDGTVDDQSVRQKKLFAEGFSAMVVNRTEKGFTIILNKRATEDITFSWVALAIKDAKTSRGKKLAPTQIPQPTPTSMLDIVVPTDTPEPSTLVTVDASASAGTATVEPTATDSASNLPILPN